MNAPLAIRLADNDAERVRQSHDRAIRDIQAAPGVGMLVIPGVVLPGGVPTLVAHKLGIAPSWVGPSAVRGSLSAGSVAEVRNGTTDRSKNLLLVASGFDATITIDLLVVP